jgi:signal peptidase II
MCNGIMVYWIVGLSIFSIDRITKQIALTRLADGVYQYTSFLSGQLVINRGISWGMFHSSSTAIFFIVSLVIALITYYVFRHAVYLAQRGFFVIGHVCVVAGSLSNLIDRIFYHGVIDFILISYHHFSWPVFNIADAAIVCGVMIMIKQIEAI